MSSAPRKVDMRTVPERLRDAARLFEERNAAYGNNYLTMGRVMDGLFPDGLVVRGEREWRRLMMLVVMQMKWSRYAMNFKSGGHQDSVDDCVVYASMLSETDGMDREARVLAETDALAAARRAAGPAAPGEAPASPPQAAASPAPAAPGGGRGPAAGASQPLAGGSEPAFADFPLAMSSMLRESAMRRTVGSQREAIAEAIAALDDVVCLCQETHRGQERAHTVLSQIHNRALATLRSVSERELGE